MFIFGSLAFGALTYNLYHHGPLLAWDKTIANTLPAIGLTSPPIVKILMDSGFYLGEQVITVFNVILFFYFLNKRFWQEFAMLLIGSGGFFLNFLCSFQFDCQTAATYPDLDHFKYPRVSKRTRHRRSRFLWADGLLAGA